MSKFFQKLDADQMALGVWLKSGPSWVSTLARAGFDFVRPDMMFSAIDWRELDHMHKAALAAAALWLVTARSALSNATQACFDR